MRGTIKFGEKSDNAVPGKTLQSYTLKKHNQSVISVLSSLSQKSRLLYIRLGNINFSFFSSISFVPHTIYTFILFFNIIFSWILIL